MPDFVESITKMLEVDVASFAFAVVLASALFAGMVDARRCLIPNWLTFGLVLSGLLFHLVIPNERGWLASVLGLGFGFIVLLPFFALGGVGAGDVKLLAGIGAWVGLHDVTAIFLVFGTLMGLYSTWLVLFSGEWRHLFRRNKNDSSSAMRIEDVVAQNPRERNRRVIPMAPAMAIAILILALVG